MENENVENVHPETLKERPPETLYYIFSNGVDVIASYGWFILGFGAVGLFVWHNWLQQRYQQWREAKEEQEYAAKYHKDPDIALDRQRAIEAARKRMQEENDAKAAIFAAKQKEKEEARRLEKEAERARLGYEGHRLGNTMTETPAGPDTANNQRNNAGFRPEYNPLIGGGGSGGYRASRRSCPGGGCG